jgi:hypothetical protein
METPDNLDTLSWGTGGDSEMNYVELPRKPSQEEIDEIQRKCNEIIGENLPITVETPQTANSKKLSDDYDAEKGIIQIIKIGDLDNNAYTPLKWELNQMLCKSPSSDVTHIPPTTTSHSSNPRNELPIIFHRGR